RGRTRPVTELGRGPQRAEVLIQGLGLHHRAGPDFPRCAGRPRACAALSVWRGGLAQTSQPRLIKSTWPKRRPPIERQTKAVHATADCDRFGKVLVFLNGRFDCKVSGKDTAGDFCIYDTVRTKKGGPPLHYHHTQDEWFFVRDGEFLFQVGQDTYQLKAGDSILGPRKVPHAFANLSETGKLMIVYQTAGSIEEFFVNC